ncbi:MAG: hypothetical protein HUU15_18205, partial [Candidatus Brocadiae bacterium]|nr:hypothetical protein [Candidatus Brocadiia bacterium]
MERRHVACLAAAALLLLCWIVQTVLFFGSDPDMLALARTRSVDTIAIPEPSPALRIAVFAPAGEDSGELEKAIRAKLGEQPGTLQLLSVLGDFAAIAITNAQSYAAAVHERD